MSANTFKTTKKSDNVILDWLNKSKTTGHCGFLLTNLQSTESLYFVPDENIMNDLEELRIRRSNLNFLGSDIVDANIKNRLFKFFDQIAIVRQPIRYAVCAI